MLHSLPNSLYTVWMRNFGIKLEVKSLSTLRRLLTSSGIVKVKEHNKKQLAQM